MGPNTLLLAIVTVTACAVIAIIFGVSWHRRKDDRTIARSRLAFARQAAAYRGVQPVLADDRDGEKYARNYYGGRED